MKQEKEVPENGKKKNQIFTKTGVKRFVSRFINKTKLIFEDGRKITLCYYPQ